MRPATERARRRFPRGKAEAAFRAAAWTALWRAAKTPERPRERKGPRPKTQARRPLPVQSHRCLFNLTASRPIRKEGSNQPILDSKMCTRHLVLHANRRDWNARCGAMRRNKGERADQDHGSVAMPPISYLG